MRRERKRGILWVLPVGNSSPHHNMAAMPTPRSATRTMTKRAFAVKTAERAFLRKLAESAPTAESEERAARLVEANERARQADFLDKYRRAA